LLAQSAKKEMRSEAMDLAVCVKSPSFVRTHWLIEWLTDLGDISVRGARRIARFLC